jgi:hypothetical protein
MKTSLMSCFSEIQFSDQIPERHQAPGSSHPVTESSSSRVATDIQHHQVSAARFPVNSGADCHYNPVRIFEIILLVGTKRGCHSYYCIHAKSMPNYCPMATGNERTNDPLEANEKLAKICWFFRCATQWTSTFSEHPVSSNVVVCAYTFQSSQNRVLGNQLVTPKHGTTPEYSR